MNATDVRQLLNSVLLYGISPLKRWTRPGKPTAFVLGLSTWKDFITYWLPQYDVVRKPATRWQFWTFVAPRILSNRKAAVYVWGFKHPPAIKSFCKTFGIPFTRMEDGFIRSVALGATKAPPLSLCFDSRSLYFDATTGSDLEAILQSYDFQSDPQLIERAKAGISALINSRLSKYNTSRDADIAAIYGPQTRKRILVVGQVEGDASLQLGCDRPINNNDLVLIAARENPDAQIIYKPHPEVLHGTRAGQTSPYAVKGFAQVLDQDITLADAFQTIDHVYTITSLSGFEALIRGIKVTCVGAPFYSGWGATDDRQPVPRRTAKRSVEEIFAAAYILYAKYYDPIMRKEITFEEALSLLGWMKERAQIANEQSREMSDAVDIDRAAIVRQVLDILAPTKQFDVENDENKTGQLNLVGLK